MAFLGCVTSGQLQLPCARLPVYIMFISLVAVKTEYIKICSVLRTVRAMQQSRSHGFGVIRFSEYSKLSIYKKGTWITSHLSCEVNS